MPGKAENKLQSDIAAGLDGAIWFTQSTGSAHRDFVSGQIGRLDLPRLGNQILVAKLAHSHYRARPRGRVALRYTMSRPARVYVDRCSGPNVRSVRAHTGKNTLTLRAPRKPGRYTLNLTAFRGGQIASDTARLVIRR